MNAELKEKWCQALESGEIAQGNGVLAQETDGTVKMCCLGVLLDVMKVHFTVDHVGRRVYGEDYSFLPKEMVASLGFRSEAGPELRIEGTYGSAAFHNDQQISFKSIARAIREQVPEED